MQRLSSKRLRGSGLVAGQVIEAAVILEILVLLIILMILITRDKPERRSY
jgi:hypothetical protein